MIVVSWMARRRWSHAACTDTATWQVSTRVSVPAYWREARRMLTVLGETCVIERPCLLRIPSQASRESIFRRDYPWLRRFRRTAPLEVLSQQRQRPRLLGTSLFALGQRRAAEPQRDEVLRCRRSVVDAVP